MRIGSKPKCGLRSWQFSYRRLDERASCLLNRAASIIAVEAGSVRPYTSLFHGRVNCCPFRKWLMVPVRDRRRPPREKLVVFNTDEDFWSCPTGSESELGRLVSKMGLVADCDAIALWEAAHCDFGLLHKSKPPEVLTSREDADAIGLSPKSFALVESCLERSLYVLWHPWGGSLIAYSVDLASDHVYGERTLLAERVGHYRELPFYLRR
jgi:hypothetical protein